MCGIYGAIGRNINMDKLGILCLLNQSRGEDSTGYWDGKHIRKGAVNAMHFLQRKQKRGVWTPTYMHIGHTRLATCGDVTRKNAHPLFHKNIVGVHNGCLWNFEELQNKYSVIDKMQVDSHAMWYLVHKKGLAGLKEVSGYGAIVWHNLNEKGIWLASFNGGTLHYTRHEGAMYFASEKCHLLAAFGAGIRVNRVPDNKAMYVNKNLKIRRKDFEIKKSGSWYGLEDSYYSMGKVYTPAKGKSWKSYKKAEALEDTFDATDSTYDAIAEQEARIQNRTSGKIDGTAYASCAYCQKWERLEREYLTGEMLCPKCLEYFDGAETVHPHDDVPPNGEDGVPCGRCELPNSACKTCAHVKTLAKMAAERDAKKVLSACGCGAKLCGVCKKAREVFAEKGKARLGRNCKTCNGYIGNGVSGCTCTRCDNCFLRKALCTCKEREHRAKEKTVQKAFATHENRYCKRCLFNERTCACKNDHAIALKKDAV